jgi:hypothetical protein
LEDLAKLFRLLEEDEINPIIEKKFPILKATEASPAN